MMNNYLNLNKEISFNKSMPSNNLYSRMMFAGGKMNTSTIIIIVLVILFIILALYYYYYYYVFPKLKTKYNANNEHLSSSNSAGGSDKQAELLFFYADWCPHCKTAKPEWDKLKAEYANKPINGYKVIFTDIDCTKQTAEIEKQMAVYNIEAYPTFKLIKGNQVIDFDAKPIKDTFVKFLNTVL